VRTGGTVRWFPIRRGLLEPTISLLDGSLSQWTGALALLFEKKSINSRECSPGGAFRADGTLGNTGKDGNWGKDRECGEEEKRGENLERGGYDERSVKDEKRGTDVEWMKDIRRGKDEKWEKSRSGDRREAGGEGRDWRVKW